MQVRVQAIGEAEGGLVSMGKESLVWSVCLPGTENLVWPGLSVWGGRGQGGW